MSIKHSALFTHTHTHIIFPIFSSPVQMKMDLQLYKAEKKHYLLDFKHLPTSDSDRLQTLLPGAGSLSESTSSSKDGGNTPPALGRLHTLEFFELCAMVITELGR